MRNWLLLILIFSSIVFISYNSNIKENDTDTIFRESESQNILNKPKILPKNRKDTCVNMKDSLNRKQGLWISKKHSITEAYYNDDKKNGIFKYYYPINGTLGWLGEYKNDVPIGIWHYFDEMSHIIMIQSNIEKNTTIKIKNDDNKFMILLKKSYLKLYASYGVIKGEGSVVTDEDVMINFYKIGIWKYYNKIGEFIRNCFESIILKFYSHIE